MPHSDEQLAAAIANLRAPNPTRYHAMCRVSACLLAAQGHLVDTLLRLPEHDTAEQRRLYGAAYTEPAIAQRLAACRRACEAAVTHLEPLTLDAEQRAAAAREETRVDGGAP